MGLSSQQGVGMGSEYTDAMADHPRRKAADEGGRGSGEAARPERTLGVQ